MAIDRPVVHGNCRNLLPYDDAIHPSDDGSTSLHGLAEENSCSMIHPQRYAARCTRWKSKLPENQQRCEDLSAMRRHAVSGPWRIEIKTPSPTSSRHYSAVYAVSTEFVKRFSDFLWLGAWKSRRHPHWKGSDSIRCRFASECSEITRKGIHAAQQICDTPLQARTV